MTLKKSRSTEDGRVAAYEAMKTAMREASKLTDAEIVRKLTELNHYSYWGEGKTREQILTDYAISLAQRIIRA